MSAAERKSLVTALLRVSGRHPAPAEGPRCLEVMVLLADDLAARAEGVGELIEAIEAHRRADTPERRAARARAQELSLAQSRLHTHPDLDALAKSVADGSRDPYSAAEALIAQPVSPVEP